MSVYQYDPVAGNNTIVGGVNVGEGIMTVNQINNAERGVAAEIAQFRNDTGGFTTTGGSANAQTLTTSSAILALNDGTPLTFIAGFTNTGPVTLDVNALGPKAIQVFSVSGVGDPAENAIQAGGAYSIVYDASLGSGSWIITNTSIASGSTTILTPEDFGAVGDDATNDTVAIQAAEDAAAALYVAAGKRVRLFFSGTYLINDSILKKTGVDWVGSGAIKHIDYDNQPVLTVATQFSLVLADATKSWSIDGMRFFSINQDTVDSNALPKKGGSNDPGSINSSIDGNAGDNWVVRNCEFIGFSYGVKYQGCDNIVIRDNWLADDTSSTVADILAGIAPPVYNGTFGIGIHFEDAGPSANSTRVQILNNRVETPGLDVAIYALSQTYDEQPSMVIGNYISGARCGVQIYRGSFPDPGGAPTLDARIMVHDNYIHATWEQGVYIRSVIGATVRGNFLVDCGKVGTNGAGTSAGGIVTRVNPFNPLISGTHPSAATVTQFSGVEISDNYILNPGSTTECDGAIQARVPGCHVFGNRIVRDEKVYTTRAGDGIVVDQGEGVENVRIEHNHIYNFLFGITVDTTIENANGSAMALDANHINLCGTGMSVNSHRWNGCSVRRNDIRNSATVGILVRTSPFTVIEANNLIDCVIGIQTGSGSLSSDVTFYKSLGTIPAVLTKRQGGTLVVRGNTIIGSATAHARTETAPGDDTFAGRCRVFEADMVDGRLVDGSSYASAAPLTSDEPRTWDVGEVARNSAVPIASALYSAICDKPGTGGTNTVSTTCTTATSTTVTTLADWDGIGPEMYVSIDGIRHYIVSVDPLGDTMEVDPATPGSGSVALTDIQPTFLDLSSVGAT